MALQSTTALATVTLQAASSTVTFSGIPNSYRDLILVLTGSPIDSSYPETLIRFNSDSATNYSHVNMTGNGSGTGSASGGSETFGRIGRGYGIGPNTSSVFVTSVQIIDYSATNKHKTVLARNNVANAGVETAAVRWANSNDAINSIQVYVAAGGFAAGSTFSLYGRIA